MSSTLQKRRKTPEVCRSIGRRIASLRKKASLTQEVLAEAAEVDASYLARIEIGQRQPSIEVLARIAERLGVPVGQLFPGWSVEAGVTKADKGWIASARKLGRSIEGLSTTDLRLLVALADRLAKG